jgi:hypothetical protein
MNGYRNLNKRKHPLGPITLLTLGCQCRPCCIPQILGSSPWWARSYREVLQTLQGQRGRSLTHKVQPLLYFALLRTELPYYASSVHEPKTPQEWRHLSAAIGATAPGL